MLESKLDVIPPKISDYSSSDDGDDVDNDDAESKHEDGTINNEGLSISECHPLSTKKDFKSKNEIVKIMPSAENSKNEFNKRVSMLRKQPCISSLSVPTSDAENQSETRKTKSVKNNQKPFLVPLVQK